MQISSKVSSTVTVKLSVIPPDCDPDGDEAEEAHTRKAKKCKMVPFYGTVYKSSLYDLIIPFPAREAGRNGKKDVRLFLRPGIPKKANNLIINSLWIVFYVEWHQLKNLCSESQRRN